MPILITGGCGYIGSHTCVELLNSNQDVVMVDNLSNSNIEVLNRIKKITAKKPVFYEADIKDTKILEAIIAKHKISAVVHFAGFKAVEESVTKPLEYYDNNVSGTIALLKLLAKYNIRKFIFSSSATVYGNPKALPITEDFPLAATNPYGQSKLIIEDILRDLYKADNSWQIIILRYFNPVGAHSSGLIGESPKDIPNNLMPYISQVAIGKLNELLIFGDDYVTDDGTGVRDYIHVVDLARAHLKALEKLQSKNVDELLTINIGTGRGYSVLEMVNTFSKVSQKNIPYKIVDRRLGDIAKCYADASFAKEILNWQAEYDLRDMCIDTWNWQSKNPNGY